MQDRIPSTVELKVVCAHQVGATGHDANRNATADQLRERNGRRDAEIEGQWPGNFAS
jgi:hypothetical protein